jgi:hypothetical protein
LADVNDSVVGTGDFDGNGSDDIVVQTTGGDIHYMMLDGTDVLSVEVYNAGLGANSVWNAVAVGDFSGDGKPDLVFQDNTGLLATWDFDGPTNRVGRGLLSGNVTGDPAWRISGAADYDGDGDDDILFQHSELGLVAVWFMNGRERVSGSLFNPGGPGIVSEAGWLLVGPQ